MPSIQLFSRLANHLTIEKECHQTLQHADHARSCARNGNKLQLCQPTYQKAAGVYPDAERSEAEGWRCRRACIPRRASSQFVLLREEMLVSVVPSNPKPCDRIAFKNAKGTKTARYSYRPDIFFAIDTFKVQRGVIRIFCPQAVGFSRTAPDSFVQPCVGRPKRGQGCGVHNWS